MRTLRTFTRQEALDILWEEIRGPHAAQNASFRWALEEGATVLEAAIDGDWPTPAEMTEAERQYYNLAEQFAANSA